MNDTQLGHRRQMNYIKLLLLFFLICIALFWQLQYDAIKLSRTGSDLL